MGIFADHGMCDDCFKHQHECHCHDDQRVEQLREEFEAARKRMVDAVEAQHPGGSINISDEPEVLAVGLKGKVARVFAAHPSNERVIATYATIEAARRYIIARDFNEFDPDRADMLWKLQNNK